jgi:ABC-type transporter Mla subunit MlaD
MATLSGRYGRPHRRRERPTTRRLLLQAGIGVAVVVGLVWLSLSIYGGAPWNSYKTIYVAVPDTGNLQPHQPVRIDGVDVGQVKAVGVTEGGEAKLQLQLNSSVKLPTGTTF